MTPVMLLLLPALDQRRFNVKGEGVVKLYADALGWAPQTTKRINDHARSDRHGGTVGDVAGAIIQEMPAESGGTVTIADVHKARSPSARSCSP